MERTCPKCDKQLLEAERLDYRFCPHCGAELAAEPQRLDDAFLTVPPDLPPPQTDQRPMDAGPPAVKKTGSEPFDDQTIAPHPTVPPNRPEINAPNDPPPSSFFRKPADRPDPPSKSLPTPPELSSPPPESLAKPPEPQEPPGVEKKQPPRKNHKKVFMAVLILLAVLILIMGGLFTF